MPTVLVTGANRGLGFEFTRQYAAEGWTVIACCRTPSKADALQSLAKANSSVRIEKLDVDDDKNILALAKKLETVAIDVLINCAGIFSGAGPNVPSTSGDETQRFGSLDSAAWIKVLRTNTIGPVMVAQAFQNHLMKGKGHKLIMISSSMGSIERMDSEGDIAYRTSKAALNAAARNISLSLLDKDITVVCLHPGWVRTDMGGEGADLTPEDSVSSMRRTIAGLKPQDTGHFFTYDVQVLPW
ncbi:MAG: SDR family oxidoreductase [Bdellovibrionales bacterium]